MLLTRDRELSKRRGLHTLLIESEVLEEQVREVQERLSPPPQPPLSRCAVCNSVVDTVSPAQIADRVPPYILRTHREFRRCPGCGRVYWPGSHLDKMGERMEKFNAEEHDNA